MNRDEVLSLLGEGRIERWNQRRASAGEIPSLFELEALPGIGPVIARRIVEGRPYRSVEELDRVRGIGKKRLEEIRPLISTE